MATVVSKVTRSSGRGMAKPAAGKKPTGTGRKKKPGATIARAPAKKAAVAVRKKPAAKKPQKPSAGNRAVKEMTRYRCRLCGYIYSPLRGEPHNGIPEGTAFEDLPDDYVCPVCGQQGKGRIGTWGFEAWRPTRYLCSLCSYIYDESRGEPHRGIKPGTKFEDLPEDYSCPVCAMDPKIRDRFGKVFKNGFEPLNL